MKKNYNDTEKWKRKLSVDNFLLKLYYVIIGILSLSVLLEPAIIILDFVFILLAIVLRKTVQKDKNRINELANNNNFYKNNGYINSIKYGNSINSTGYIPIDNNTNLYRNTMKNTYSNKTIKQEQTMHKEPFNNLRNYEFNRLDDKYINTNRINKLEYNNFNKNNEYINSVQDKNNNAPKDNSINLERNIINNTYTYSKNTMKKGQTTYIESFNNLKNYEFNKLDDKYISSIKRENKELTEEEYEKFMKVVGTTKKPDSFVVFDLETTGLSPRSSEILEIGAIRFTNEKPIEVFHTYVKPTKKISKKITAINGITDEKVKDCESIDNILPYFLDFIDDDVLIAHNSSFDMSFILENLYKYGYKKIKNKSKDTLKMARQKIREYDYERDRNIKLESYKLESLKYDFELYDLPSHNSLDDCKVCAYIYLKMINEYDKYLLI